MAMDTNNLSIGILRKLLILFALIISSVGIFARPSAEIQGWPVLFSIVCPSLAVMLIFTIALDVIMNVVFRLDSSAPEQKKLTKIIRIESVCLVLIILCWSKFTIQIFQSSIG